MMPFKKLPVPFIAGLLLMMILAFQWQAETPGCLLASRDHILFKGIENRLTMMTKGIPEEQVTVSVDQDGVLCSRVAGDQYVVRVDTFVENVQITVSDGNRFSKTFLMRVKRVPFPEIFLGDLKRTRRVNATAFRIQQKLVAANLSADADFEYKIHTFEVSRWRKNEDSGIFVNKGGVLNAAVKDLLSQARSGDIYTFDNINVLIPGEKITQKMLPIQYEIR